MTYRTFKRLLGETSLERKCRFLFGGALMLLIAGSFYFYAHLNLKIIRGQYRQRAQLLIGQNLLMTHWSQSLQATDSEAIPFIEQLSSELKPSDLRDYSWRFIHREFEQADPSRRPIEPFEHQAFQELFEKGTESVVHEDKDAGKSHYFEKIVATESCVNCHRDRGCEPHIQQAGDVMAMARVTFELQDTRRDIANNNAVLITMAMVTALLAMAASYVIVRYVVVKPVMHLKEVSDAIAHGDLDQRADIRTGDEFEELSHAFNRMLRHLVTTQEELRQTNTELDYKVDELAQANLSLHEMNQIKNDFLATMSHEIRTPMNGVMGMLQLLADRPLDTTSEQYISTAYRSAESLLAIIDDILDLSKIEAGKVELEDRPFDPATELVEAAELLRERIEGKGLKLIVDCSASLPSAVRGDVRRLRQVITNLSGNAVKFTSEGEIRLTISALPLSDGALDFTISVADSGIGIPPEIAAKLFDPFTQADSSTTRVYGGTGLGLAICRRLVEQMSGSIWVESEPGKGSNFIVTVPLGVPAAGESDPQPETPAAGSEHALAGGKVLLVEDNAVNQRVAVAMLETLGLEVSVAPHGESALELFRRDRPGIVLMDLQMPVMDGFAATERIRADEAAHDAVRVPIVALTANVLGDVRETCLAAGMDDVVMKPFRKGELAATLSRWLEPVTDSD